VTSESEKAGFVLLLAAEAVAAGLAETELGKLTLCILFSSLVTRHSSLWSKFSRNAGQRIRNWDRWLVFWGERMIAADKRQ